MIDWMKAKPEIVERVVREGEIYLDGQLKLATSADQRAAVLASVFTAAASAVLAGLSALAVSSSRSAPTHHYPIFIGGGGMAACFFFGAAFCISAIFPVNFWLPGSEPESWRCDVLAERGLQDALRDEAKHIQSKISDNRGVVEKNARRFKWGAILGISAPAAGLLLWIVTSSVTWIGG